MEQYISKSALVAEIERRIKINKECMLGLRNTDYFQGKVDALNDTLSLLDTIETKEVDEEYNGRAMLYVLEKGVKQGRRELIENACKWWEEELSYPSMTQEEIKWYKSKVNKFRKAMEG